MDRKIAGLLGAAAVLTAASAAYAAAPTPEALPLLTSCQDLVTPIPNPVTALQADDARLAKAPAGEMQIAQAHHHHHRPRRVGVITIITARILRSDERQDWGHLALRQ